MSTPYLGEIRLVGFNFAPVGWAICNGATLAIDQNNALFTLIGTTYGGDGVNTFKIPDLQGRVPIHQGTNAGINSGLGQTAGSETVTLTTPQLPAHTHSFQASTALGTSTSPKGGLLAATAVNAYIAPSNVVGLGEFTTPAGSSQPHENMMPFLCANFIIALEGIYPSQG